MRVFVSGKVGDHEDVKDLIAVLSQRGHNVTFDWTSIEHLRPYDKNAGASQSAAELELAGVRDADVVIVMVHPRGVGLFVELGAALALGKHVIAIVSGADPTMFLYHPLVMRVSSTNEALAALECTDR